MPREGIHPQYFDAKFVCTTCNNEFICGTTKGQEVRIDTCSNCHPFYTGAQTFANAAGRVERFNSKFSKKDQTNAKVKADSEKQKALNDKSK